MVNLIFKKIVLFYMALALAASPIELLAAHKKSHKRVSTSQKKTVSKYRNASRHKAKSSRLRAKKEM